ncbi:hypothetical protein BJX99DRAFT_265261 [Aspergillus californicus]
MFKTPDERKQFFEDNPDVNFLRLHWVDFFGILRARVITRTRAIYLATMMKSYHISSGCMSIPIYADSPNISEETTELCRLEPDWGSLEVCGFNPTHASVMCCVSYSHGEYGPYSKCPRIFLSNNIPPAGRDEPLILVGFELQFVFLDKAGNNNVEKSTDPIVGHSMMSGLRDKNLVVIEEIVAAIQVSGREVWHFHTQAPGQFEIALGPRPPIEAADGLNDASRNDPYYQSTPWTSGNNVPTADLDWPAEYLPHARLRFFAGIPSQLKPLCALGLASYDSYEHTVTESEPGSDSKPTGQWVGWGTRNKEFPIRQLEPNRWEFRFLDATANIYLFLGAVLAVGIKSMEGKKQSLVPSDCSLLPSRLSPEETERQLKKFGITEEMPQSFEDRAGFSQTGK